MSISTQLLAEKDGFRRALLAWYQVHRRALPWRSEPSLYRTVVSEFMLQQTQVKTVLPYFARWMEALPNFAALAAAPEEHVLKLWEGLGYYSRARNLQRLAREIAQLPSPPRTPEAWQALPGIGPYTAAAITSIAFHHPAACVDGNVVRILARLTADATRHRDSAGAAKAFGLLATAVLNPANPGDHNQAMMELGATVCSRKNPDCSVCPVSAWCAGRRSGYPERYPRLAPRIIEHKEVLRIWCVSRKRLLLHKAGAGSRRLAHQHELPTAEQAGIPAERVSSAPLLARKRRGITRYRITESIHRIPAPSGKLPEELSWVPISSLGSITLSGPHRRWVEEILAAKPQPKRPEARSRRPAMKSEVGGRQSVQTRTAESKPA
ncbi:MAG: A/G-specific adenine glycosylase [Opitutaceae bacterium]|jgi:A/G-specific adenine glycosylase